MRIWHGSGLWYHCPITKTPGDRQVKPLSNAALPAPQAAFKSPDGEEDWRGDEGSCARGVVEHHERRPGTRFWPLGTSQSGARRAGEAPAIAAHKAHPWYSSAYLREALPRFRG
jgi:hypothetical protein